MTTEPKADQTSALRRLPRGIWALGFVSMFMDISSEMIHALLPVFLVTVLGAGTTMVGLIEGVGEATAAISKLFSGWLSDRIGKRKVLTVIGYGLATLSKPLFALAPTADWVLFARFSDRVGKGIRGAPRDALVGDIAPPEMRGAAYGLRQSLDTVGAFLGPLLGLALMALFADNFRLVFWVSLIPGAIAVAILVLTVREPAPRRERVARAPIDWSQLKHLGRPFWAVVAVGSVLTLARFSEAFLILRATNLGLSLTLVPLVLVIMNIVYAASAYPMGAISDRMGRRWIVGLGFAVLILADLVLGMATTLWQGAIGIALWGLHMGMTQGLLTTLVADRTPQELRGTGFGVFHLVTGIAILFASLIAGILWDVVGPSATFFAGATFTTVGVLGALMIARNHGR